MKVIYKNLSWGIFGFFCLGILISPLPICYASDSPISFRLGHDVINDDNGIAILEVDPDSGEIMSPKEIIQKKNSKKKHDKEKNKDEVLIETPLRSSDMIVQEKKTRKVRVFEPYSYELDVEATYYFYHDEWPEGSGTGLTYRGNQCVPWYTVAVDPDVIPLGSKVIINGKEFLADDIGGAIRGNKIDIAVWSREEAFENGRRWYHIKVIPPYGEGSYRYIDIDAEKASDVQYINSLGMDAKLVD